MFTKALEPLSTCINRFPRREDLDVDGRMLKWAGFEVLTAVTIKSIISWDVTPCGTVIHRRPSCCLRGLALDLEDGDNTALRNVMNFYRNIGVITSQTTVDMK